MRLQDCADRGKLHTVKALDRLTAALILLLGVTHIAAGFILRGRPDIAGMWFLSGGLMMIFQGLLNLVRVSSHTAAARGAALAANILSLAFMVGIAAMVPLAQNPQVIVLVLLVAAATAFSLRGESHPTTSI